MTVLLVAILGMDRTVEENKWGENDNLGAGAKNAVLFLIVEGVAVVVVVVNAVDDVWQLKHEEVETTTNLQQSSNRNGTGNQQDEN